MSKKLLIIGCGDHGVVAANTALLENKWKEICFLDDKKKDKYKKYKIVGKAKDFKKFIPFWDNYFISIGDNLLRKFFFKSITNKKKIVNIIHPSVSIGQNFIIGNGNIILSNSVISDNNAEKAMIKSEMCANVQYVIDQLSPNQKEVVVLRHFADLSFKEIAKMTNVSINTALGRMRYALANMRKFIEENNVPI